MPSPISPAGARLTVPTPALQASFLIALREYHVERRHLELDRGVLSAPRDFAAYVQSLVREAGGPPRFEGWVPQTVLWWVADGEYLGRLNIRHHLTDALRRLGGHIGYDVRPSARRRGHGTAMLAAALPVAAELGIDPAWIDCDIENLASRRVIEKNGGRLAGDDGRSLYFRVPTGAAGGAPAAAPEE